MRFLIPLFLACALYATPNGIYLEGGIQHILTDEIELTGSTKIKYEQPESYAASFGYQTASQWSFEVEGAYTSTKFEDTDKTKFKKLDYLANIYYNAYNETNLVSSIGVGYGKSKITIDDVEADEMPTIYHGTVGLGYMFNSHVTLNFKYKYLKTNEYTVSQITYDKRSEYILSSTLRFMF